ncbi:VanW family protein [Paenibacillus chitinolyticus]|uniref:VanW family protein n=1 Tax=Paenibacillus chitinolyticus TaxID=79263 RepID=UPI0026820AB2
MIYPGETFSFWKLIGKTTKAKGYIEGLMLSNGEVRTGTGADYANWRICCFYEAALFLLDDDWWRALLSLNQSLPIDLNAIQYRISPNRKQAGLSRKTASG